MQISDAPVALLFGAALLLAGFWLFFPILIWAQLRQAVKLLREIRDNGQAIDENTRKADAKPRGESSVRYGS